MITHERNGMLYLRCIALYWKNRISCCLWKNDFALAVGLSWQKQTKCSVFFFFYFVFLVFCFFLSAFHLYQTVSFYLSFIHVFFFSVIFFTSTLSHPLHTHFSYRDIHQRSFEVKNIWILNLEAYNNFTTILAIVSYCFMLPMRMALEHICSLYLVISELL